MQGTINITMDNCGRRFQLKNGVPEESKIGLTQTARCLDKANRPLSALDTRLLENGGTSIPKVCVHFLMALSIIALV